MKKKQYITPELEIYSYAVEEGYAVSLILPPPYDPFDLDFSPDGLAPDPYSERGGSGDEPWNPGGFDLY